MTSVHDPFGDPDDPFGDLCGGGCADASGRLWDGHLLLLYGTEPERRARLAHWVRRGLERGETVVYAEEPGGPPRSSLAAVLRDHGVDAGAAARQRLLRVLPPGELHLPGAAAELVGRVAAERGRGVRLSAQAEAAAALGEGERGLLESALAELCRSGPVTSALCQYDAGGTAGTRLRQVVGAHLTGIRHGLLCTDGGAAVGGAVPGRAVTGGAAGGDGAAPAAPGMDLVLAGEIDDTNDALLRETLRAATATSAPVVRLDISRVSFVSAAGWRAVADGTRRYRASGGRLVLLGPQPGVARIARLVGVDRLKRVEVRAAPPHPGLRYGG